MKRTSLLRWAGAGLLAAGVALSLATPATAGADTSARTVSDLSAAQVKLDKAAATRPSSVVGWYVDQASRSLVVEVHGADSAVANWASTLGAGAVKVKHVAEAYKPLWNVINGQAITTTAGARCSAGFNARSSSGARYVIDAGHCGNLGGTWSGPGGTLGTVASSSFPTNDYSRINVSSSSAVQTPLVDRYSSGSDVTVTGPAVGVERPGRVPFRLDHRLALRQRHRHEPDGVLLPGLRRPDDPHQRVRGAG